MNKKELRFRNMITDFDEDFAEFLLPFDYQLLEMNGVTSVNPFEFRTSYWSKPTDEVTINPNANLGNTGYKKNFCNLVSEMASPINKLSALTLIRKYAGKRGYNGDELITNILEGDLYHHNLTLYDMPYCVGLSVYSLTFEGLDFSSSLKSNPPRRPTSFVNQVIRYLQYASNYFAGATALTDFFANYSYYTAKQENYTDKQRENDLQNLVHGVTDEIRLSGQSPFTNISLCGPDTMRTMLGNYQWNGYKTDDLIDEIMHNQLLYTRFFSKGVVGADRKRIGLPFRFPITTLVADRSFEKEYPEEWDEILEGNNELCYLNILNNYDTDLKRLSMCCRLTQNIEDMLDLNINNTFGSYLQVGSHAVVTVNLPRIALKTKNEDKYIEILEKKLNLIHELLLIHRLEVLSKRRIRYHYFFKSGKLNLKRNFFSTIGFLGISDAVEYLGMDITEPSGIRFAKRILSTLKDASVRFSKEDDCMYNIEEVPGESASGNLAMRDKLIGGTKEFYNTQFVPLGSEIPLSKRVQIEGDLQSFCTGGSICHLNINGMPEPHTTKNFIKKILNNSKLTQFALNKGFTVCKEGHTSQGVFGLCPSCRSEEVEQITRIVGYFVPVSNWNKNKQEEFRTRKWSKI